MFVFSGSGVQFKKPKIRVKNAFWRSVSAVDFVKHKIEVQKMLLGDLEHI